MKRLIEQSACVHRQFNVCTFLLDSGDPCPGGESREVDLRLIGLAASAWLYEHDMGGHASLMDGEIDKDALAEALDGLEGT